MVILFDHGYSFLRKRACSFHKILHELGLNDSGVKTVGCYTCSPEFAGQFVGKHNVGEFRPRIDPPAVVRFPLALKVIEVDGVAIFMVIALMLIILAGALPMSMSSNKRVNRKGAR